MIDRGGPWDQQHVRCERERPREHQLGGCDSESRRLLDGLRSSKEGVRARDTEAERTERHKRNASSSALLEYRLGRAVRAVKEVLHTRDLGQLQRVQQVRARDVAE